MAAARAPATESKRCSSRMNLAFETLPTSVWTTLLALQFVLLATGLALRANRTGADFFQSLTNASLGLWFLSIAACMLAQSGGLAETALWLTRLSVVVGTGCVLSMGVQIWSQHSDNAPPDPLDQLSQQLARVTADLGLQVTRTAAAERRCSALTQKDKRIRQSLFAAGAFAVHWREGTGEIIWHIGEHAVISSMVPEPATWATWGAFCDPSFARCMAHPPASAEDAMDVDAVFVDRTGISRQIRMKASRDPAIKGEGATWTGMFRVFNPDDALNHA